MLYTQANYTGTEGVAARAKRIFAAQMPPDWPGIAAALNARGLALQEENQLGEAEPLMRRMVLIVLRFTVATGHPHPHPHPHLRVMLNNYASLLKAWKGEEAARDGILSLGPEAGMTEGRFREVLAQALGG